jgi:hypothetical protein
LGLSRGEKSYYDAVALAFFYAVAHPLTAVFGGAFIISIGTGILFAGIQHGFCAVGLADLILRNVTLILGRIIIEENQTRYAGDLGSQQNRHLRDLEPPRTERRKSR